MVGSHQLAESAPGEDLASVEALYPSLRRFAGAVAGWGSDPDDLVQEAFVRTLTRKRLDELDDPLGYLRRAVLNLVRNDRRRWFRRRSAVGRLDAPAAPTGYPSDLSDLMHVAPVDRALLYLVVVEGATYGDAAKVLGISPGAARSRATRARQRLRATLEEEEACET